MKTGSDLTKTVGKLGSMSALVGIMLSKKPHLANLQRYICQASAAAAEMQMEQMRDELAQKAGYPSFQHLLLECQLGLNKLPEHGKIVASKEIK